MILWKESLGKREGETQRQREREGGRERQRQREREGGRHRERERERETVYFRLLHVHLYILPPSLLFLL